MRASGVGGVDCLLARELGQEANLCRDEPGSTSHIVMDHDSHADTLGFYPEGIEE